MSGIDMDAPGTTLFLMGNEAIARGALEGGVGFAAAYPGTPSTEILESLAAVAKKMGIYAEWSVNEMVSVEAAAGASFAGIRAIVSMKHFGLQTIVDFLSRLVFSGIGAGLVLVSADDTPALSSITEGDMRHLASWLGIPVLEPGDSQEAKDMTRWLLDFSEELGTICMLRSATRISHSRSNVRLGELPKKELKAYCDWAYDIRSPMLTKFKTWPVAEKRLALQVKLDKAREKFESLAFNWYVGPDKADLLVITCGCDWLYCQEAVRTLKLEGKVGILKLGTTWPLPEKFVEGHLSKSQKVLVVEEPDPFLERNLKEFVANLPPTGPHPIFYGKQSGHISPYGEQNPDTVIKAITCIMDLTYQARAIEYGKKAEASKTYLTERVSTFCPGCPHRASFWSIKNALNLDGRNGVVVGDVGCYSMARGSGGFFQSRMYFCMGAGPGIANGLGKLGQFGLKQPVLCVCGDSTFYHASIPALINGVFNSSNFVFIILDNNATAMTGFQPHPGSGITAMGEPTKVVSLEALCRSTGARVEICDPFDLKNTTATLLEMMGDDDGGVRVVIMRRECELTRSRREKPRYKVHIDPEKCFGEACGCNRLCSNTYCCSGLIWDKETAMPKIDEVLCAGCGVCVDVCPHGAIIKEAT